MSTETKQITIKDKPYFIKRFNLEEGNIVDNTIKANMNDALVHQTVNIFYGTIKEDGSRLFDSMEDVKKIDRQVGLYLWVEIQNFNQLDPAFLSLSKSLQSPVAPPLVEAKQE